MIQLELEIEPDNRIANRRLSDTFEFRGPDEGWLGRCEDCGRIFYDDDQDDMGLIGADDAFVFCPVCDGRVWE